MSNICLLDFNSQEIRTVIGSDRSVWFVAADVCTILDISNVSDACKDFDEDEKQIFSRASIGINDSSNGASILAISEAGFYQLIFKSRKPEAKAFQKWVTKIVIPSIRATGTYKSPEAIQRENWINARQTSKIVSQFFTAVCLRNHYNAGYVHDQITIAVTGKTAAQLREHNDAIDGNIKIGLNHIEDIQKLELVTRIKITFASMSKEETQAERLDRVFKKVDDGKLLPI
jgi:prophage antirepressor-like protein